MSLRFICSALFALLLLSIGCNKSPEPTEPTPVPAPITLNLLSVDSIRITYEPGDTSVPFPVYRNFWLKPDAVYRDVYTSNLSEPSGEWKQMSEATRQKVKHLLSEVPENLLDITYKTYHNSDNYSCNGETTVRAYKDSVQHTWFFPNCKNGVPDSVVDFATKSVEAAAYLYSQ